MTYRTSRAPGKVRADRADFLALSWIVWVAKTFEDSEQFWGVGVQESLQPRSPIRKALLRVGTELKT